MVCVFGVNVTVPLKSPPYGTIKMCLLLLLIYYDSEHRTLNLGLLHVVGFFVTGHGDKDEFL